LRSKIDLGAAVHCAQVFMSTQAGFLRRVVLCLIASVGIGGWLLTKSGAAAEDPQRAKVRIAITFDDLPGSAVLPPGYTSERLLEELTTALEAHHVKGAVGFVIGSRLAADAKGEAALAHWAAAGQLFGNHSFSHDPWEEIGDGYFGDVAKMEPLMRALERAANQGVRYFRYPYLQEGRTLAERRQLSNGLTQLGYTLARVSLDFRDWEWADAYNRCLAKDDEAATADLATSYVEYARKNFNWTLAQSEALFHRPLTHVLLLHANVATAQNLDALLTAYEEMGAEFVSLADALVDPVYTAEYNTREGTLLTLASAQQAKTLAPEPTRPALATACP
jgi:peptidoglycan/xylan/chitin deacetylase (PgdA/CDA1 family)